MVKSPKCTESNWFPNRTHMGVLLKSVYSAFRMFPIIPHHVGRPQTSADLQNNINNNNTKVSKIRSLIKCESDKYDKKCDLVAASNGGGVGTFAATFLPKNSLTDTIPCKELNNFNQKSSVDNRGRCYLKLTQKRVVVATSKSLMVNNQWLKMIRLSSDIYSYNALLETTESNELQLRIVRNVSPDEEILLWFSERIVALMQIPFLTPINIQGQNRYICHTCSKVFESPNPLKFHIATSCEKRSIEVLWHRLCEELNFVNSYHERQHLIATQRVPPIIRTDFSLPTRIATLSNSSRLCCESERISAFHPVQNNNKPLTTQQASLSAIPTNQTLDVVSTAAAHLETIVSNMGTSKNGHLCIYCGKLYSRKYGLKIHIRTHTGFKPLKCKYCHRPFGDPSNLNKHVRLHIQSDSIYKCNLCDKVLVRRRDLQRHIQTRHITNKTDLTTDDQTTNYSSSSSDSNDIDVEIENT